MTYYFRRGNEQPRFKPPRILRQEALEQARKEEHDISYNKPVMHKVSIESRKAVQKAVKKAVTCHVS